LFSFRRVALLSARPWKKIAIPERVTEMLLNLLRMNVAKGSGGLNLHVAGAKVMGWLGNAWGDHFYLSW